MAKLNRQEKSLPPPNTNAQTAPATSPTSNTTANAQQPNLGSFVTLPQDVFFASSWSPSPSRHTRWEARTIEQTVYEPANAPQLVPPTTYVPQDAVRHATAAPRMVETI